MITDKLENAELYYSVNPHLSKGFRFLKINDISHLEAGKYEIDGDNVFAFVQEYNTKPAEQGVWEAHHKYIDIQYVHSGEEYLAYTHIENLRIIKEYDPEKEFYNLEGEGDKVHLKSGYFSVLFPQDGHIPQLNFKESVPVKKVVVKVAVE
ncbi:MAG: YhcH/YjgK/YiaL family protein [Ignavibacteriaceae bacterium]|nr:YhcH/YjgK/YiaL family protein [Ignavibacteriaceae bacterium]